MIPAQTPKPTTPNTDSQNAPKRNVWYTNYMVWVFVIGLPIFVMVSCIFFIMYAAKIKDSTVRDDWYMDGKALYQDASKDQLAYDLGVSGIMRFDGEQVTFELNYPPEALSTGQLPTGALNYPKTLAVVISHATDKSRDRDFVLAYQQDNVYTGTVALDLSVPSRYYVQVSPEDGNDKWRLMHAQRLPASAIRLEPLPAFAPAATNDNQ